MNSTTSSAPIQVLLVEDDPDDVRLTREALRNDKVVCGTLSVVSDADEAMAFLRRQGRHADAPRPDVILLDLSVSRTDGLKVLREVKANVEWSSIPVVVVTGPEEERDIALAQALRADCFVTRPVGIKQFVRVVSSVDRFWFTIVKLPADAES